MCPAVRAHIAICVEAVAPCGGRGVAPEIERERESARAPLLRSVCRVTPRGVDGAAPCAHIAICVEADRPTPEDGQARARGARAAAAAPPPRSARPLAAAANRCSGRGPWSGCSLDPRLSLELLLRLRLLRLVFGAMTGGPKEG